LAPNVLDELFRNYSAGVFRRAKAILGDPDAAKDVMQEVFLRAVKGHAAFSAASSPIAWLYRVTTNLCLKRLRDTARHRRILTALLPSRTPATEQPVDSVLTVRALMRHLPTDLQEIAIYYFVDQMSQNEISELMGISRRTVGHRLERIRAAALSM
jgi:RNA polymerase sigma-70 factor (ECF subfamily)